MSWMMSILSAILLSLGLGTSPDQPKGEEKCEPEHVVSVDELGAMLETLGYEPEKLTNPDGSIGGYKSTVIDWAYTVPVYFELSADKQSLTVTAELAPLSEIGGESHDALVAFLQRNNLAINPYVYGINEHSVLTMQITIPLSGLTEDSLLSTLWDFESELLDTEDLWYFCCPIAVNNDNDGPIE